MGRETTVHDIACDGRLLANINFKKTTKNQEKHVIQYESRGHSKNCGIFHWKYHFSAIPFHCWKFLKRVQNGKRKDKNCTRKIILESKRLQTCIIPLPRSIYILMYIPAQWRELYFASETSCFVQEFRLR